VTAVLEQDRDAIYHAVMQDPIVQARLTLDDTWRMTDELIKPKPSGCQPGSAADHPHSR
jgi:alpha-galactosidase/6-phospho-beta-glucosidase family protein